MEQIPDPFAAEQTYLNDEDIKQARQRKGSYDDMDQEMAADEKKAVPQPANLEDIFEKMQI